MSDTPRSDAAEDRGWGTKGYVPLEFARGLERELAAAQAFQLNARTADTLDAERYRYLRDLAALEDDGPSVCSGLSDLFEYHFGPEIDEIVDDAIARWKART